MVKRVLCNKLRKQGEVTVAGKQCIRPVGETDRGNPCVMDDRASHARTLYEATQDLEEAFDLANQMITR